MATKMETKTTGAETPAPNLKYVGKITRDENGKLTRNDQPVERIAGAVKYRLPSAESQIKNPMFYNESAGDIAKTFPELYKVIKPKG